MTIPQHDTDMVERLAALLDAFEATLDAEFDALGRRDVAAIESLVMRKRELSEELDALINGAPTALTGNAELQARIEACRHANARNGGAIDANRHMVTELLRIYRGETGHNGSTYNAGGRVVAQDDRPSLRVNA